MGAKQAKFALKADIRIITFEFVGGEILVTGQVVKGSIRHFGRNGTGVDHGTADAAHEMQIPFLKKRLGLWFSANRTNSVQCINHFAFGLIFGEKHMMGLRREK